MSERRPSTGRCRRAPRIAAPAIASVTCILLLACSCGGRDPDAQGPVAASAPREPYPIESADAPCDGIVAIRLPQHHPELRAPEYLCYPPGALDERYIPAPPTTPGYPPAGRW